MMKKTDIYDPTCPIRNILGRMSDKWTLLVLCDLSENGTMRYMELIDNIPDISHKMLTLTLKHLEEDHLIQRRAYAEIPPRVEYSLSEAGKSLMYLLQMMIEWTKEYF
jgi:DNA-binding HxlR family transcriptional regulator